jgi:DNA polymerase kappa
MLDKLEEIKKAHTDDEQVMEIIDRKIASFEAERDLSQIWFHVDMDAFFASVEIRDNPQLRGKPIAVGDMSMITTSSYEARKWGVRSAMPGFIAKELCPELIFVPPNFAKYKEASKKTRQVFGEYDPQFESWSLDEAALSLTDYLTAHRHLTVEDVVKEIQRKIYDATQLTCSIGVAANKRLAKIVTDINKPNGYFILPSDAMVIKQFVSQLPCRKIPGIGKVTNQLLAALKIEKVGQLLEQRLILYKLFSERSFDFFMRAALGLGSTVHDENGPRKSIGRQRTFKGLDQKEKQLQLLRELCELVAKDLKKEQLSAKKVTVVYKTVDFELKTKCQTLPRYINTAEDIFFFAHKILSNEMPLKLRLLGVRMSAFKLTENSQNDLLATNQRQISKFLHGRQPTKEKNEIVPCEDKKDDDSHDSSVTEENDYQDTSSGNNDLDGLSPSEIYKRLNKKMKERISEMQETNTNSGSKRSLSVLEQTGPTKKRRVLKGQQTLEFFFQRKEGDSKSV